MIGLAIQIECKSHVDPCESLNGRANGVVGYHARLALTCMREVLGSIPNLSNHFFFSRTITSTFLLVHWCQLSLQGPNSKSYPGRLLYHLEERVHIGMVFPLAVLSPNPGMAL